MEYIFTKYPVKLEQLSDNILSELGLFTTRAEPSDLLNGNIIYADANTADNLKINFDVALTTEQETTLNNIVNNYAINASYKGMDWSRRRDIWSPHFYAEAGSQLENFSSLSNIKKLNACLFFLIPYNVRTQIISDEQDAINWNFLLTKAKESRIACVEAMRIKVGQYMRLGTITLEQTQDFYTQVYKYIIWFDEANKPDFKQWLSNEVGSAYENAGFAQMPYFDTQMRDDLLDIYNGSF
jgi:hypothetical protein